MEMTITPKQKPKMCLNMIVKNESHIVEQTLEKLIKKIDLDYWVISDTGSTDNTKEIITNFFKRNNIPGEIYDDEWQNFAHNRTKALEHAYNKSEYLLVFDADDEISGDFKLPENISANDAYYIKFGKYTIYKRILIVNNKKKWRYESVVHEYICNCEPINKIVDIEGDYYILERRAGNRSLQADKYLKDALILENAHKIAKESNDQLMLRYAFYCANSYRDANMTEEAIKWYKITLSQDNWAQEKYVSCLNLYELYSKKDSNQDPNQDSKETKFYYLVESFKYDTQRAECLVHLVNHYCNQNMNQVAFNYYLMTKSFFENDYLNSSKSTLLNDKLFVNIGDSDLKLPYYMILVSDRVQEFTTTYKMYEIIFTKKYESRDEFLIGNMLYNLKFFIEGAIKANDNFMNLFQDYFDFLIEINYPLYKHDFIENYEKYGLNLHDIFKEKNNSIFSIEECKNSKKILLYTGYTPFRWNNTYSMNNPLGGSETAAASLSKNFPSDWTIYVGGDVEEEHVDNVTYVHLNNLKNLVETNAFHTIIVSRYLNFYEHYKNFSAYQTYIWAHDIYLYPYGTDLSVEHILKKWSSKITACVCQTEWHKNYYLSLYPQLNDKINIINNGINEKMFANLQPIQQPIQQPLQQPIQKKNNRFIYTSCSERGLVKLIELWPSILENLPDAELMISSYNTFPSTEEDKKIMENINKTDSIKYVGKLNRKNLYELMATAEYWLYPTDFQETSCITSLEMLASEVVCLYYPIAGLVDTLGSYGIQISDGNELDTLLNLSIKQKNDLKKKGKEYALSCSWANRASEWMNMFLFSQSQEQSSTTSPASPTSPTTNPTNIKIINLKKREDRKKSMIEQFERENIPQTNYEFIEAVDGQKLKESEELRLLFEGNNFNYRRGVIGCALSHSQLWYTLTNDNDNEYYVILEDDLELFPDFKEKLESHCKLFEEKQLEHLSLGVFDCNELDQEKIKTNEITIFQKDVYKFWNVAFAYIISKAGARKMISYINRCSIKCAIDNPQAHGEVIVYHHTTSCIVRQRHVNEVGTDIQHNYNSLQFTPTHDEPHILKIAYCDWWYEEYCGGSFDLNNNFITDILKKYGNVADILVVDPTQNPDVLFYSIFGNSHTNFPNVRKVFFSGEPFGIREEADFNFTFDRNSDKNTRFPLWLGYMNDYLLEECNRRKNGIINVPPQRERFCSFISNGEVKTTHRRTFVDKLSNYKKVHCGGKFLNNIGYHVPRGVNCSGKIEHNNNYKFAIAFENEDYPGYVTEKICDVYKSNCIPIYWGTKEVVKDFNPKTFINATDFANFDDLVEYIIKVDNDEELYNSYFQEPMFSNKWLDAFNDPNKTFYKNLADCIIGKNKNLFVNLMDQIQNQNQNNVIFLNTSLVYTGIHHYGLRLFNILKKSTNFNYLYFEIQEKDEYYNILQNFLQNCNTIIYNYTGSLWPWLNKDIIRNKNIRHIGIPHEEFHNKSDYFFDIILNIDPTAKDAFNSYTIPRPIYEDVPQILNSYTSSTNSIEEFINYTEPNIPIIGSFGFGFNTKGFDNIVKLVNNQYDNAIIKLVITFPYNDINDSEPKIIKEKCERNNIKPGIKLLITHEFFSNEDILNFLSTNTINVFLYDDLKMMRRRSISSVLDYALSVDRPIGISSCSMFRNIYNDDICLEKISIQQCIDNYPVNLKNIKKIYEHNNVIRRFDDILKRKIIKKISFDNNIEIKYGTTYNYVDIKPILFEKYKNEKIIYINAIDDNRSSIFSDPCYGIEKYISININNNEFIIDQNFYIYIDIENKHIYINCKYDTIIDNNQEITIKKMKVVFSNNCSIGDIYFSQPFIKNIVTNNPEHDYYIYHQTSSYYFTDILEPNIKDVNKLPEFKEELCKIFNFKIDTHKLFNIHNMSSYTYRYDKLNNILLICTWLGALRKKYRGMVECDMLSYNETYNRFITDINQDISSRPESNLQCFKYNDNISLDLYPCVPTLNIDKYREFQKLNKDLNKDKKIIFYYNVLPSSGQSFPIKNNKEHDLIISILAENNIVVVANKNATISSMKNVYFADDFLENVEYYDAKNFYHHAQMAYESDYSVYYDSGRNFMYMNKTFILENNKNIRLHLSNNDYYFKTLTSNLLIPDNYSTLVMVTNCLDIINKLKIIIPNISLTQTINNNDIIIKYGIKDNNIDITNIVFEKCKMGNYVYIPDDDAERNNLFSDPLPGIFKYIFIYNVKSNNEVAYDYNTSIYVDLRDNNKI
jgi:GR25 family glycosyltransferase involved in LPS biosynthesis